MSEMDHMQEPDLIFISKANISQSAPEPFFCLPKLLSAGEANQLAEPPQRGWVRTEKVSANIGIHLI